MNEKQIKKILALLFLAAITILLLNLLWPFVNAFLGAIILFFLTRHLQSFLVKKLKWNKRFAAIITITISLLIIIIPLYFLISSVFGEIDGMIESGTLIPGKLGTFLDDYNLRGYAKEATDYFKHIFIAQIKAVPKILINLVIMYFTLFYLLINNDSIDESFMRIIPFSKKNSRKLLNEFKNMTYSGVVTAGLIAVLQGSLIAIGFLFFKINGALLWGLVGALVSFLPFLGTAMVWVPAAVYALIGGNYYSGIGMFVWGTFLSNIDNVIRPGLQQKIGQIHPLITLIGIFIGIPLFGILGIVVGPLLLSYFLLSAKMFKEEYLSD
ncbi:AI-2E family transporter [Candidatus Pacearchaeota archaeon]|nr:AI-2E family transporter [Candidatus Pacearchaeota archaeon]